MDPQAPNQNPAQPEPAPPANPGNPMAIAGFVLSFFFAPLGLILSIVGLKRAKVTGGTNQGLAVAGLIISIVGLLLWALIILALIFVPEDVSVSAVETFDADTSSHAVEVVSYKFADDTGFDDLLGDLEQLNKLTQTFYYEPAKPSTCSYYLDGLPTARVAVEPDDWVSYGGGSVAISGLTGNYALARDCGQWQQVAGPQ